MSGKSLFSTLSISFHKYIFFDCLKAHGFFSITDLSPPVESCAVFSIRLHLIYSWINPALFPHKITTLSSMSNIIASYADSHKVRLHFWSKSVMIASSIVGYHRISHIARASFVFSPLRTAQAIGYVIASFWKHENCLKIINRLWIQGRWPSIPRRSLRQGYVHTDFLGALRDRSQRSQNVGEVDPNTL